LSSDIISAVDFVKPLEEDYAGLKISLYKLRAWYSLKQKLFFDCDKSVKNNCLESILQKDDFSDFVVFLITKDADSYQLMDIVFRNLGSETLKHFIKRYTKQLNSMTKLSLQSRKIDYIKTIGYTYKT
jgi:hypothetical protein